MTTFGLDAIILYSANTAALGAFYERLGVVFERREGGRLEAKGEGGVAFVIEEAAEPLAIGRRSSALSFRVADVGASVKELVERGIAVEKAGRRGDRVVVSTVDPDGRRVDLWAEAPNPKASPEPPPLIKEPAVVEAKAPAVEPPAVVVEKPAVVEPPAMVAEKPAVVEPPAAVVEKPAMVDAAPAVIETPPAAEAPPEPVAAPPPPPAPPARVGPPGPIVTAARPGKISVRGGTKVSLYGANFAEGCSVTIGGQSVEDGRLTDDFELIFLAPAHPAGPVDVVLENPDGQRSAVQVIYDEGPTIERFSPLDASPHGGDEITVEGRNFDEGCHITFFGMRSADVIFDSHERVRFRTPPQQDLPFQGEIRLTNLDGLYAVAPEPFLYRLATPLIRSIAPSSGLLSGGKRVSIAGVDFHAKCIARLGGAPATVVWKSAEALEVITPRGRDVGPADLEIENPDGQVAKLEAAFTFESEPTPPILVDMKPTTGLCEGGTLVYLFGENFEEDTLVRIGEVRAVSRFISRKQIEVELPARSQPGPVAVELKDRHGVVVRREDLFTYEQRSTPRVASISPRSGPMTGGTRLIIEGEHFDDHVYVRIGGQAAKLVTFRGGGFLEVVTPPSRSSGLVDVEIGRTGVGVGVAKSGFRYDASAAPIIDSVGPNKGSVDGGTEVGVEGKNFVPECVVLFGRTPAQRVKFISGSSLEVKAPPGKNGEMVDIIVRNPDGKEATVKRAFLYDARYRG